MEELSVEQVIQFSQTIEEESYNFYTEAKNRLADPSLKTLAEELASAEVDHLNRLRKLLDLASVAEDELERRVPLDTSEYQRVVAGKRIEDDSTARDILQLALARETATANTYKMLVSMTNLGSEIVDLFSYLAAQETGHVKTIENKLNRL